MLGLSRFIWVAAIAKRSEKERNWQTISAPRFQEKGFEFIPKPGERIKNLPGSNEIRPVQHNRLGQRYL